MKNRIGFPGIDTQKTCIIRCCRLERVCFQIERIPRNRLRANADPFQSITHDPQPTTWNLRPTTWDPRPTTWNARPTTNRHSLQKHQPTLYPCYGLLEEISHSNC